MQPPQSNLLPDGRRLHLQHGPIDLIVGADGDGDSVHAAFGRAVDRFSTILDELCAELPLLRQALACEPEGAVGRRMYQAVAPFAADTFITPMAAVAGSVAEAVIGEMLMAQSPFDGFMLRGPDAQSRNSQQNGAVLSETAGFLGTRTGRAGGLTRAYVNNGGDIALYLAPGESFRIGLIDRPDRPSLLGTAEIRSEDGIAGIATSGWRGRSFSLGIADAVTVLAATAPGADAAATILANAIDLPGHPAIRRERASDIQPDNDLRDRLVTRDVGPLRRPEIETALARGIARAETLIASGLIRSAALHCAGVTRVVGWQRHILAPAHGPKSRHIREVEHAHG